jgi:hypothetical protein
MPVYKTLVPNPYGRKEGIARVQTFFERSRSAAAVSGSWAGNAFQFVCSVQGVRLSGDVEVGEDQFVLDLQVPWLAMPFTGWITNLFRKGLEESNPEAAPAAARMAVAGGEQQATAAPVVLFLHIPKAGGSTLGEFVYTQCCVDNVSDGGLIQGGVYYCPFGFVKEPGLAVPEYARAVLRLPALRAVIGHFWYGIHQHLDRRWAYLTALRNPVERVVSLYYFLQLHDKMSLDDFATSSSLKEVDNDQTRRLCGEDPDFGQCTPAMLRRAQDNLRRDFAAVGVIERLEDTIELFRRKLGWDRGYTPVSRNVNPARPRTDSLPASALEAIRRRNALDEELYQFAVQLLDEGLAGTGRERSPCSGGRM